MNSSLVLFALFITLTCIVIATKHSQTLFASPSQLQHFNHTHLVISLMKRVTNRLLIAITLACCVYIGFAYWNFHQPELLGIPLLLAPGLSAAVGLLFFSIMPLARYPHSAKRSASLNRRSIWSYSSKIDLALPATSATLLIAFLLITGVTSSADEYDGHYRSFTLGDGSAGPYPGWFYGIPLIIITLILLLATIFTLHRIASNAAAPIPEPFGLDTYWREVSTRIIIKGSTGTILGYFAAAAFFAGSATYRRAKSNTTVFATELTVGISEQILALALLLFALTFIALMIRDLYKFINTLNWLQQPLDEYLA